MKKLVLLLSTLVAVALADGSFQAAYHPLATEFLTDPGLRIFNGRDAERNQFPYQISLQIRNSGSFMHYCGGSIISPEWIVTAAHCTSGMSESDFQVKAGILLLSDKNIVGQQTLSVSRIINHPGYPGNEAVAPNDISLLQLSEQLNFNNNNVQPIALPVEGYTSEGSAYLSGWGLTGTGSPDILQYADLPIIPADSCKEIWDSTLGPSQNPFSTELNTCTGSRNSESSCQGDSGGPFAQNGTLIGVVSWGLGPCGAVDVPSVYVTVSAYINWITEHTGVTPNQF